MFLKILLATQNHIFEMGGHVNWINKYIKNELGVI